VKASAISDALRVLVCDFTHNLAALGSINWPEDDRKALFSMRHLARQRAAGTIKWPRVQNGSIKWPKYRTPAQVVNP
jgi:hypothetical protein